MKRRALQVIVFLLLGAIVNVAVAWGFAIAVPHQEYLPGIYCTEIEGGCWLIDLNEGLGSTRLHLAPFGADDDCTAWPKGDLPRWTPIDEYRNQRFQYFMVATGWPSQAMLSIEDLDNVASVLSARVQPNARVGVPLNGSILPTRPLWPGFAINTIFYAAVLWVMFTAPFALRRRLRGRRGLCPACAYPIGSSPVCTECGKTVTPRSGEQS